MNGHRRYGRPKTDYGKPYRHTAYTPMPPVRSSTRINHFTDLRVYQQASDLASAIFILSRRWPTEERFSLTDQVQRAARSVGANIAESWGKRRYPAHFVSKLSDADTENHEVEYWLITALRDGYLISEEFENLLETKKGRGKC